MTRRDTDDDETDSKEKILQTCLNGSNTGSIDLTVLREAACSPGGLCSTALRRQAWPKLAATHQVLLGSSRLSPSATDSESSLLRIKQLRRLVRSARWSRHTPFSRVTSNLSLDLSVSSPTSLSLWPSPCPLPQTQKRKHQGSFQQDNLASEEQETLLQLLQHLQRRHPNLLIHQGTADMLAVLWRVLDQPSLTSITSLQLYQYHWQPMPVSASSFFHNLLERMDATLHHHFQELSIGNDAPAVPHCIQESWIPHWMSRDVDNFELLTRLWDVLLCSHPLAIMYVWESDTMFSSNVLSHFHPFCFLSFLLSIHSATFRLP